jgi:hypothetical protein
MRSSLRAGVAVIGAVALGISLAGCGSNSEKAPSSSNQATVETTTSTTQPKPPEKTIAEYIKDNNITETPVKRGDPGAPVIDLPVPPGWVDMSSRAPEGAYQAMVLNNQALATDPPTLVAYVAKLSGNVDPAKILEYAPAEIQRLPGYQGPTTGTPTKVGGFDATQIGGAYTKDGAKRAVGQMTAVIPVADGVYVLQVNADSLGKPDQVQALTVGSGAIAMQAKITP